MSVPNPNSEQCRTVRRHLDAYLSNELPVEISSEIRLHLETCAACARELAARTRLRDALRRATASQAAPEKLRLSIEHRLRNTRPGFSRVPPRLAWALALILVVVLAGLAAQYWRRVQRGKQIVASVLQIGVADHVQCALIGHNYPEVANPPEVLRKKLGPRYAGLLEIVQQKLPGFEVLEAHICTIPGSPRKYIHFITRGRGTILSVILTRSEGAQFPNPSTFRTTASGGVNLYEARLDGMNAAGFESRGYLGFVVSDLSRAVTLQIASELAPPLKAALDASSGAEARLTCPSFQFRVYRTPGPRWDAPLGLKEDESQGIVKAKTSLSNAAARNPFRAIALYLPLSAP